MAGLPIDLEKVTLNVALGSIFSLGVFLCIDSTNGTFLGDFERYVSTESFGVVAAIPAIAVLYLIGAFISLASDLVFQFFNPEGYDSEWRLLGEVVRSDSEIMAAKFNELYVQKKILEGSVLPFLVLAVGIFLEKKNLPNLTMELTWVAIFVAFLALIVPFFTTRIHKRMDALIEMHLQYTGLP